jgi:hypothetical protein
LRSSSLMNVCSSWRMTEPFGVHRMRPWPTSSSMWNSFSSRPSLRWSRSLACSSWVEVVREFLLGGEGGAVDALELLVLLVAAVVGAGDGEELERLQLRRVAHVRAGAEVDELAVLVERNFLALGDVGEAAELVALLAAFDWMIATASSRETSLRRNGWFSSRSSSSRPRASRGRRRELVLEVDVVVEAGVRRRTDVEFGVGKDAEEGGRQHVRAEWRSSSSGVIGILQKRVK